VTTTGLSNRTIIPEERLTLTVPEVARLLGVSRMTAYTAVREGTIPSIRIGRRVLIPRAALYRLLAKADAAGEECAS
jgi:excisionase family DNA binding protein